ncbi:sensor histidine kinase [Homoserinibacter sp. YIM 151385]|uniref:sensor histidine kinase n=1 Tax=Homoserinibacter sp. YIM 151385 TaxID=2985506 RepID=UPI0022F11CE8|nr:ATP-binding protein [Homoserinibacter sp. YIM 151385]WBU38998.1 ATP-binding protein [Homoserinibacter sp. YIM 151385]
MVLRSVRARILASIIAVATLGLGLAGATAYLVQRERIVEGVEQRLLDRVETARAVVTGETDAVAGENTVPAAPDPSGYSSTREALRGVLERIVPGEHESAVGLLDGRAAFIPGVAVDFHLEDSPALVERVVRETSDGSVRIGTAVEPGLGLRYIAVPIEVAGDPQLGTYLVAFDLDGELADLDAAFGTYALVALGAVAAIGLVGWFVAGRALGPVRRLRETASRITVSDLSERIPVGARDEVGELTATVNGMLDRLESSISSQRQLLDDVRHELKTPITIVRGHLELLDPADVEDVRQTRELSIGELDRMADLVDRIELLAQVPHDVPRLERAEVAELTRQVHAMVRVIPGHEWSLAAESDVVTRLDPQRITQAWLQLADNAAKYSPEGAPIRIGSSRRDGAVELWVEDEGEGIPADAEARIFERFGRADAGRGVQGSGLGLPIVRAIAEAHGGRVSLQSSSAGSRFAIVLPIVGRDEQPTQPLEGLPVREGRP